MATEGGEADDPTTGSELLPLVYHELRRLAAAKLSLEPPGQTLQPTALVHEVWIRLSAQANSHWKNRQQFHAVAAEAMRRILVDRARSRKARKHGGDLQRVPFDDLQVELPADDDLVLRVHEALDRLEAESPEKAQVVKLRFFVGLGNAEVAAILGASEKTVHRHWSFAKAWLARSLQGDL